MKILPALLVMVLASGTTFADRQDFISCRRGQRELTLSAAVGASHRLPESARDLFSLGFAKLRYGRFTSPRNQWAVELGLAGTDSDRTRNILISGVGYRRYFLVRRESALGLDLMLGAVHFNERPAALGTSLNFCDQVGLTYQRAVRPDSALSLEYRFLHASNAGIKRPNIGINMSTVGIGLSWYR